MKKGTKNHIILCSVMSFMILFLGALLLISQGIMSDQDEQSQPNMNAEMAHIDEQKITKRMSLKEKRALAGLPTFEEEKIALREKTISERKSKAEALEELHHWVQDGLTKGIFHSVNIKYNEVRIDPIVWGLLPNIETKQLFVNNLSRYFDLKGSTGRVTIRSKYSDEKLASYSVWTGIKIYK